jgi:hypothetical protein
MACLPDALACLVSPAFLTSRRPSLVAPHPARNSYRSPLDPAVSSQYDYDWGGDFDADSSLASAGDPMASMLGELDSDGPDGAASGGAAVRAGLGVYVGPRRVMGPGELFGEIR